MKLTDHTVATDVLHDYARLKLDLAGIVRTLLYSAEKSKDELSIQDCRRVLARLAEDRFNLAIVGQFSRGKSSLMNALLGMEKLPTGILPLTSVITTVTYGEKERVLLLREGWSTTQEIRLDQLPEYVTQGQNPGNEKKVLLARCSCRTSCCGSGCTSWIRLAWRRPSWQIRERHVSSCRRRMRPFWSQVSNLQ